MTVDHILSTPSTVTELIRAVAAAEIMPRFRKLADHEIEKKESGELVTAADHAAERVLAERLQPLIAGSLILGEEGAAADPTAMAQLESASPVWVIDPVDGTKNFAAGDRCFAVIIALCLNGQTLAGWIYNPNDDVTAVAVSGGGAWVGDTRLSVAIGGPITNMRGSLGPRRRKLIEERTDAGIDAPKDAFRYGCAGMEYFHLADGTIDFAEYVSLKPWDHAAGVLIHDEAGGYSADTESGHPYVPREHYRGRLLIAPDIESWEALRIAFADD